MNRAAGDGRRASLTYLLLLLVTACMGCGGRSGRAEDVFVEDPTTLAAVRALHAPPEVVVNVERVTHSRGGTGGSCHSAACLVLLPVLVVASLLPPEVTQHATVTTDGEPSYIATFDDGGAFLLGQVRDGDAWREVQALPLERLDRRPIVSTRRLRRGADGQELSSEPLPLLPQAPLDRAYEAALAAEDDPEKRGELLVEALTWLGREADAVVLGRLRQPALHDTERALATAWFCSHERGEDTRRAEVVRLARDHGATESALAALHCFRFGVAVDTDVAEVVRVLAKPYCEGDDPYQALSEIFRRRTLDPGISPWTAPPALQCEGPRGELLRAVWGGRTVDADPAIVARGFRYDPAGHRLLELEPHYEPGRGLPPERLAWRTWHLGAAARALAMEPASCPAVRCDPLVGELRRAEPQALTDDVLDAAVDHYAALPTVDADEHRRAMLLQVLHGAGLDATRSERLRRRLQAHETRLAPNARPAVATARLVLGDTSAAAESLRGAWVGEPGMDSMRAAARFGTDYLITDAWAMHLHCDPEEIAERAAAAEAGRPITPCARATPARR
ncbi:MAG: hypothetical protein IPG81_16125 [Sandaracinaceae bacterium]|nr:hypothetical protein [Sandaracinaceae bacterium]